MTRVLEIFLTGILSIASFFEDLREHRHDDPVLAEYKARQRACMWSFVPIAAVLLLGWAAGTVLNALDQFQGAQSVIAPYRDWLVTAFAVALAWTFSYAVWAVFSLVRFVRQNGVE